MKLIYMLLLLSLINSNYIFSQLPAARLGDVTAHGGSIVVGCPTVLIGGMQAARLGDMHVCPIYQPPNPPHVGGAIVTGSPTVLIGGMPAARLGDKCICNGPYDTIAIGCPTVLIGNGKSNEEIPPTEGNELDKNKDSDSELDDGTRNLDGK